MPNLMIYGATGYTGALCARQAVAEGMQPILAGRSAGSLAKIAEPLGLETRVFGLDDPSAITQGLKGVNAVLNCAGPFRDTAAAMTAACLASGTHYLDITGEVEVFQALHQLDAQAKEASVMILPGVGFDVVPTDCTAAMLANVLPGGNVLILGFAGIGEPTQGTLKTVLKDIGKPQMRVRDGVLEAFPHERPIRIDYGNGPEPSRPNTWGDLVTAPISTGIETVEIYFVPPDSAKPLLALPRWVKRLMGTAAGQRLLNWYIKRLPVGPDEEMLKSGRTRVYGRVTDSAGNQATSLLEMPDGYALTALAATELLRRAGDAGVPGFQTPSLFAGAEFVLSLPGVQKL